MQNSLCCFLLLDLFFSFSFFLFAAYFTSTIQRNSHYDNNTNTYQKGKRPWYPYNKAIRLTVGYICCCCLHLWMIVWLSVMFPVVFTLIFDWFFIFRPVPSLFLFYINNSFIDSCYSTMGMPNEDIWLIVVYVCMVLLLASMNDCVVWLSINVILFQFIIIHCFYIYIYNHGNASF